jgi:hypothetical protein
MPALDPNIWGPKFWFFLHTIAMTYPHNPNAVTKRKYYDLIHSLPIFIPVESIGSDFSKLLEQYPITPYLDSRESFIRWMHFIHNKINVKLEKPTITLDEFYVLYYEAYKSKDVRSKEYYKWREKIIYILVIFGIIGLIAFLYNK